MTIAIWWVRRDLRLFDNQALHAARQAADQVIPLFILDPKLLASAYVGDARKRFLFDGLHVLDQELRGRGAQLVVREGDPLTVLQSLCAEHTPVGIFAEEDVSPYARQRDRGIQAQLPLRLSPGIGITAVAAVTKDDGTPYTVYTPYSRRWLNTVDPAAIRPIPAPDRLAQPAGVASDPLPVPSGEKAGHFPAGETVGQVRAGAFLQGPSAPVYRYAAERDRPDLAGTSQLSPYFRFGMVSPRAAAKLAHTAALAAPSAAAREGAEVWLSELIWREFYQAILANFPRVRGASFRPGYDKIVWANDPDQFDAWCRGATGYPFVDAAMRQLLATGWMHNRARMVVASFLVKDLLVDWRWGEQWFMQQLLDGDPAANNGGWQWAAGTGTDAAPYFRIFNPVTQSKKFDPNGDYIRRWVPELAAVPPKWVHAPWEMSPADQTRSRCVVGQDYPRPIVDHAAARERTLAAYQAAVQL